MEISVRRKEPRLNRYKFKWEIIFFLWKTKAWRKQQNNFYSNIICVRGQSAYRASADIPLRWKATFWKTEDKKKIIWWRMLGLISHEQNLRMHRSSVSDSGTSIEGHSVWMRPPSYRLISFVFIIYINKKNIDSMSEWP